MRSRGMAASLAVVLLLILQAPPSQAAAVTGTLTVESGAVFPRTSNLTLATATTLIQTPAPQLELYAHADRARVWVYEQRRISLGLTDADLGTTDRSWESESVTLRAERADAEGYVALDAPTADVTFSPAEAVTVRHEKGGSLSHDGGEYTRERQDRPYFFKRLPADHLRTEARGVVLAEGSVFLKVFGAEVVLTTAHNATPVKTGRTTTPTGEEIHRWLYVELAGASARLSSPARELTLVASEAPAVAWQGSARVVAVEGQLATDALTYTGTGPAEVTGALTAALYPLRDGTTRLRLAEVRGQLESSSLATRPAPAQPDAVANGGGLVVVAVVGAVLVASSGTAAMLWRRRRARPAVAPPESILEWCLAWADFHEGNEDPAAALECLLRARAYAEEDDFDTLLWIASCQERLGNLEEALDWYEAATAVAPKGDYEGAFATAMVAAQLDRRDKALTFLRLALMSNPHLGEDAEEMKDGDPDPFACLRQDPAYRALLKEARAWARTAEDG